MCQIAVIRCVDFFLFAEIGSGDPKNFRDIKKQGSLTPFPLSRTLSP